MKKVFVSIQYNSHKYTYLVDASFVNGRAVVAQSVIDNLLDRIGVRRGDTYSIDWLIGSFKSAIVQASQQGVRNEDQILHR